MVPAFLRSEKNSPIDLFELVNGKYKIGLDQASENKYIALANRWDLVIKCINGEIYPFSKKLLAFHCIKKIIRNKLREENAEIAFGNWSDNGEAIFLFKPEQLELIARYAKARKVRRLSEKHKLILAKAGCEALKAYRKANSKSQNLARNQAITC